VRAAVADVDCANRATDGPRRVRFSGRRVARLARQASTGAPARVALYAIDVR